MRPFPDSENAAGEVSASPAIRHRVNGRTTTDGPEGSTKAKHSTAETFNFFRHRWLGQIARDPKLPGAAIRVAVLMWELQNADRGYAWPSLIYIGRELGIDKSTVVRSIDLLCRRGWITKHKGNGRLHSNQYRMSGGLDE
jgi:Helix-turn-helix domain